MLPRSLYLALVSLAAVFASVSCRDEIPTESSNLYADVVSDDVSLRIDPVSFASEIDFLDRGTRVQVVGRTSELVKIGRLEDYWYLVRLDNGIEGWVYGPNLSIGIETVADGRSESTDREAMTAAIVGKWWEVRRDGGTGYARLYFWPDGLYKHAYGNSDLQEGSYVLDLDENRVLLEPGSAIGTEIEIRKLGSEYRLFGKIGERQVTLRRAFIDPDAPDPGEEPEETLAIPGGDADDGAAAQSEPE